MNPEDHLIDRYCADDITEEEVERHEFLENLNAQDLSVEEKWEILEESKYN